MGRQTGEFTIWTCPDARKQTQLQDWEEKWLIKAEETARQIWSRYGEWHDRGVLFHVLCSDKNGKLLSKNIPPLTTLLRKKIFKGTPQHEPQTLRWIFNRFTGDISMYRHVLAPYACNTRNVPYEEYSWATEPIDLSSHPSEWPQSIYRVPDSKSCQVIQEAANLSAQSVPTPFVEGVRSLRPRKRTGSLKTGGQSGDITSRHHGDDETLPGNTNHFSETEYETVQSEHNYSLENEVEHSSALAASKFFPKKGSTTTDTAIKTTGSVHLPRPDENDSATETITDIYAAPPSVTDEYLDRTAQVIRSQPRLTIDSSHSSQPYAEDSRSKHASTAILQREKAWWGEVGGHIMKEGMLQRAQEGAKEPRNSNRYVQLGEKMVGYAMNPMLIAGIEPCHVTMPSNGFSKRQGPSSKPQWLMRVARMLVDKSVDFQIHMVSMDQVQLYRDLADELYECANLIISRNAASGRSQTTPWSEKDTSRRHSLKRRATQTPQPPSSKQQRRGSFDEIRHSIEPAREIDTSDAHTSQQSDFEESSRHSFRWDEPMAETNQSNNARRQSTGFSGRSWLKRSPRLDDCTVNNFLPVPRVSGVAYKPGPRTGTRHDQVRGGEYRTVSHAHISDESPSQKRGSTNGSQRILRREK